MKELRQAMRDPVADVLGPPPKIRRATPLPRPPVNHDITDFRTATCQLVELSEKTTAAAIAADAPRSLTEEYIADAETAMRFIADVVRAMKAGA